MNVSKLLQLQQDATFALEGADTVEAALDALLQAICRNLNWPFAAFWHVEGGEQLICGNTYLLDPKLGQLVSSTQGNVWRTGQGLPGAVLATGKAIWKYDVLKVEGLPRHDALHSAGVRGMLGFPLRYRGEILGVCEVFSYQPEAEDPALLQTMENIGVQIGQFLRRQRIERELKQEQREQAAVLRLLKENEQRLRQIFDSALDAVVVSDEESIITDWNAQAERIFGWKRDEAVGRPMCDLIIPEEFRERHRMGVRRFLESGETRIMNRRIEITALRNGGELFPVELTVTAQKVRGHFSFTAFIRDISDRKAIENELKAALLGAQDSRDRAEAASNAKSEFLRNMSHEIRTPMNAISGTAQLLAISTPLTDRQREYIRTLQVSSDSLLTIINDLLDISRIEAGKVQLEARPFSLMEVVGGVTRMMAMPIREKGLALVIESNCSPERRHLGDATRLRQVILNLVSNALKFTERGKISIRISCALSGSPGTDSVSIAVQDTGIGIAPEKQEAVFEKFIQADSTISKKYGGTGLGLAITKTLVELMQGTIELESTPGEGSTFTVRLPLKAADPKNPAAATPVSAQPGGKAPHVLVVDDYEPNILIACAFLDMWNYTSDSATSGAEALEKFRNSSYDAILMDVQMPDLSGLEVTKEIRRHERKTGRSRTPIIGVTAHALVGDRERCIQAGMDNYLAKPFAASDLKVALDTSHPE